MNPRITLITLGVDDLDKAVRFYRDGLGLKTEGIVGKEFEHGAVAFFDLQAGLKLALWPRASLAHDSGLPLSRPGPSGFALAHNVASRPEVDAVMKQVIGGEGTDKFPLLRHVGVSILRDPGISGREFGVAAHVQQWHAAGHCTKQFGVLGQHVANQEPAI